MPDPADEPPFNSRPKRWRLAVCPECSATVYETDIARHQEWHAAMIRVMREIRPIAASDAS